jgi:hypothetical protein
MRPIILAIICRCNAMSEGDPFLRVSLSLSSWTAAVAEAVNLSAEVSSPVVQAFKVVGLLWPPTTQASSSSEISMGKSSWWFMFVPSSYDFIGSGA